MREPLPGRVLDITWVEGVDLSSFRGIAALLVYVGDAECALCRKWLEQASGEAGSITEADARAFAILENTDAYAPPAPWRLLSGRALLPPSAHAGVFAIDQFGEVLSVSIAPESGEHACLPAPDSPINSLVAAARACPE